MAQSSLPPPVARALDRAFELSSVVPLGAFVVFHVAEYGRVLGGAETIGGRRFPPTFTLVAEAALVWLPLAFHGLWGLVRWRQRRSEAPIPAATAGLHALDRVSSVAALLFLAEHFVRFRLPILRHRAYPADSVQRLAAELSATTLGVPLIATLELFGVFAVAYHLGHGLLRLAERRALGTPLVRTLCVGVGLLTGVVGGAALIFLATG